MRLSLSLAALAAATALATPAAAQVTSGPASIRAEALLIQPATIAGLDDLSFGTIVSSPTDSGTVTINPNTGLRSSTGTLTLSTAGQGSRGRFIGNGNPLQNVTLVARFPTELNNEDDPTATVAFNGTIDSAGLSRRIGATGVFYVGVGGTITINTSQMPGLYSGLVELTANFQ
jgi:hypothetical protein